MKSNSTLNFGNSQPLEMKIALKCSEIFFILKSSHY